MTPCGMSVCVSSWPSWKVPRKVQVGMMIPSESDQTILLLF